MVTKAEKVLLYQQKRSNQVARLKMLKEKGERIVKKHAIAEAEIKRLDGLIATAADDPPKAEPAAKTA